MDNRVYLRLRIEDGRNRGVFGVKVEDTPIFGCKGTW